MRFVYTVLTIATLFGTAALAQDTAECSSVEYTDKNQVKPRSIVLKTVAGQVSIHDGGFLEYGCAILFTETGKKIVSVTNISTGGRFKLGRVPPGRYRLVVIDSHGQYCAANIPVEVTSKRARSHSLLIEMRPEGIDECSYLKSKDS